MPMEGEFSRYYWLVAAFGSGKMESSRQELRVARKRKSRFSVLVPDERERFVRYRGVNSFRGGPRSKDLKFRFPQGRGGVLVASTDNTVHIIRVLDARRPT